MALLILKQNPRFLETEAYRIIREWSRTILRVVEEGKASGEFRSEADPYATRTMVLGAVEHAVIGWLLLGRPSSPSALAETMSAQFIQGLENPDSRNVRMEITLAADGHRKRYMLSPRDEGEHSEDGS